MGESIDHRIPTNQYKPFFMSLNFYYCCDFSIEAVSLNDVCDTISYSNFFDLTDE